MASSTARITRVRAKVAKLGSTASTPTLAKIAVSAAKAADSSAHAGQDEKSDLMVLFIAGRPLSLQRIVSQIEF